MIFTGLYLTFGALDSGLAKAFAPESVGRDRATGPGDSLADSPTITSPALTRAGVILGTAAYMSPEQARGRRVDKRTDVWAFGCVLYELLTGSRAFGGETVAEVLGAVLHTEPDWTRLPAATPVGVRRLLARTLAKDPAARLRDIGDASDYLEDTNARSAMPTTTPPPGLLQRLAPWLALAALGVAWAVTAWLSTAPAGATLVPRPAGRARDHIFIFVRLKGRIVPNPFDSADFVLAGVVEPSVTGYEITFRFFRQSQVAAIVWGSPCFLASLNVISISSSNPCR